MANGEYMEITYAEIKTCRESDEVFQKRKFILLHGMLLEVMEPDYMALQKDIREMYIKPESIGRKEVSIDFFVMVKKRSTKSLRI